MGGVLSRVIWVKFTFRWRDSKSKYQFVSKNHGLSSKSQTVLSKKEKTSSEFLLLERSRSHQSSSQFSTASHAGVDCDLVDRALTGSEQNHISHLVWCYELFKLPWWSSDIQDARLSAVAFCCFSSFLFFYYYCKLFRFINMETLKMMWYSWRNMVTAD